jgi:hypothetical protein
MSEKERVRRSAAIAIGIICIILVACLVGAFAYYMPLINDKNNTISSSNSQITALQNQILSDNFTINSLNSQIADLENQLTSDNSTIASDNATIAHLESQVTTLQNQIASFENQITELSNNASSLEFQYEQLNQTYTSSFLFNSSVWPPSPGNTQKPQIFITYPAGFKEYANAILKICATALEDYTMIFNMPNNNYLDLPLTIHIFIYTNASSVSLGTTPPDYRIYLYVKSIEDMQPPSNVTGYHNVYGFIHELGHIMFSTDNSEFNEGWAFYAAAFRIVPEVYSQLGDDAWPQPYNYSQTEGSAMFLNDMNNSNLTTPSSAYAAAKILYMIDQKHGPLIFKEAMDMCHPSSSGFYNYPIYGLTEFKSALVSLTNDTSLSQLFQENGF